MKAAPVLPETQYAVQLVGREALVLNDRKEVFSPGPHELLVRIEAVGLCFSDVKLSKQFSDHPRKDDIVSGIDEKVLLGCRSYVPGDQAGVPGHEVACRVAAVGSEVTRYEVGQRFLVQTDYRALLTKGSNAAFGYTFEGGLQEYALLDERVTIEPVTGEQYMVAVPEGLGASAVALIEPWSCVENAYANSDRRALLPSGRLLVVADDGRAVRGLTESCRDGEPSSMVAVLSSEQQRAALEPTGWPTSYVEDLSACPDESFDDVIYFGTSRRTIEALSDKLAFGAIINVVLGGGSIDGKPSIGVGRVHYGLTRWVGTPGISARESYDVVPMSGELRPNDRVLVTGAGGPMGQMHVIRSLCSGTEGISLVAADIDTARLEALERKAAPYATRNKVPLRMVNTALEPLDGSFSYQVVLVPSTQLIAAAVDQAGEGGIIDIFAGIPAAARQEIDLDGYIRRKCYLFGTSGSVVRDMRTLLAKVSEGQIDTNVSVDAVSGMAGAIAGLRAVQDQTMTGKVVIYPQLHDVGLLRLQDLREQFPSVWELLDEGKWTAGAEAEFLRVASGG